MEQWSAIELSIIHKEIPPAPTAAMYWSRAMTYGNGGPQGPLRSHTANLVEEKLYVFGGCDQRICFNILYILDMDTLTWTKPQIYSRFIPPPCRAHTSTVVERISSSGQKYHQLYVFGGGNGPDYFNDVYVLDIEALVWTMPIIKGDKPPKRRAHSACYWNDKVIIIGGGDGVRALDDVYMLNVSDPNQLEWELLEIANSPPIARGYHTCTIIKDKIVLIGGSDGHDCFSDIYILDLVKKKWIQVDSDLKIPRLTHSATLVGSYIFVFGGHNSKKYSQDILLFNLVSMNWERRKVYGSAPKARGYHTAVLYDSRLYILGGYDGKNFFDDVYILELSSCAYLPQITNFEVEI
ncbi:galactose oxidase [Backusella circina FSU 941]|nr:galactose oxidase [Backusella circina FSU 941]